MSIKIMTEVWELDLQASQKIVLLALADAANDEGRCWPGMASLSKKCSKSERTVQAMLVELEGLGHLSREQVPGRGCYYTVHPRNSRTPEKTAPPKNSHPAKSAPPQNSRQPPQNSRQTPAKSAPKPSMNPKEPSNTNTERAHVISDGWAPEEFGPESKCCEVMANWPPGEFETQLEHFTSHHRGKGSKFVNWQDAWKTWVLNSRKWNSGNAGNRGNAGPHRAGNGTKPKDGAIAALDRRLGLDGSPQEPRRPDAGSGSGDRLRAIAGTRTLF